MKFRKNTSSLHKAVGFCLKQGSFAGTTAQQEVLVVELLPSYPYKTHRFDWVVSELFCIFECHGEQHYQPASFGPEEDPTNALDKFFRQKERDNLKEQAAIDAGYTYVIIPYWDENKITSDYLYSLYLHYKA